MSHANPIFVSNTTRRYSNFPTADFHQIWPLCSVLYTAAILEMLQRQQAARLSSQSAERRTASYIIVERYL